MGEIDPRDCQHGWADSEAETKEPHFENAALLNRLDEMQRVPYYAMAKPTLRQAELVISQQELKIAKQAKRIAELEEKAHG